MEQIKRRFGYLAKLLCILAALSACKGRTSSELQDLSAVNTYYWSEGEYYFRGGCNEGQAPSRSCKNNLSALAKNEIASVQKRLGQVEEKELLKTLGLESVLTEADKNQKEYDSKIKLLAEIGDPSISRELVNEEEKQFVDKLFKGRAALIDLRSLATGNKRTCIIDGIGHLKCRGKVQNSSFTDIEVLVNLLDKTNARSVYLGVNYMCIYRFFGIDCIPTSSHHMEIERRSINEILNRVRFGDDAQIFSDSKNLFCFTMQDALYCNGSLMVKEIARDRYFRPIAVSKRRDYLAKIKLLEEEKGLTALSVGTSHFCVVVLGELKCGGSNQSKQLGTMDRLSFPIEQELNASVLDNVNHVAAGDQHTCAVQNDGTLRCWGNHKKDQLGHQGAVTHAAHKNSIMMKNVQKVVAGGTNTCAILENKDLHCWGETPSRFVSGLITKESAITPKGVTESFIHKDVLDVAVSPTHICTLIANQGVKCWGENSQDQLGFEGESYGDQPGETLDKLPAVFKYEGTPN